jgi:hypothetical protein
VKKRDLRRSRETKEMKNGRQLVGKTGKWQYQKMRVKVKD